MQQRLNQLVLAKSAQPLLIIQPCKRSLWYVDYRELVDAIIKHRGSILKRTVLEEIHIIHN